MRLMVATLLPMFLVTASLLPIFNAHLERQVDSARVTAKTLLNAEYDALVERINESLNHTLAIAELPALHRFLVLAGAAKSPYQEEIFQDDRKQLKGLLNTLHTHFGRYAQMTLFDINGRRWLSSGEQSNSSSGTEKVKSNVWQKTSVLEPRSIYVSLPYLGASVVGPELTTALVDIATPVFSERGVRLGVLVFTVDWAYLVSDLPHSLRMDPKVKALLVDARGASLLPTAQSELAFGSVLSRQWPEAWGAMKSEAGEEVMLENRILVFRSLDLGNHHYRSQAEQVLSQTGSQPWRLGITLPRPTLGDLFSENPGQLISLMLTYMLAMSFGVFWVLTQHREETLRKKAHQYAVELEDLYEQAPCGYHSLDEKGRVVKINRTELEWLGYPKEEVIGRDYRDFVSPETRAGLDSAFRDVIEGREGSVECELLCHDGGRLPVAVEATAQITDAGFQYTRAMVFDLTERKQIEELLIKQSMTDPLTGLGNRRYLEAQADMEMARALRSGNPLSLIMIDLDHFKRINDTYGHDVGDQVLQAFSDTVRKQLREGDVLCRMGGEEFAVLLPETTSEQSTMVAERIREAIGSRPVGLGEIGKVEYSASFGVTLVDPKESSLKPAIRRADSGLYEAKAAGRDRVITSGPERIEDVSS
ncbi:PAS domain S-box-containing protein/diguanylate cyclase (GGDEF)-like protein [Marinobacter pelagius]|uniref:diguanylate cyclase n=2 Tax=Marinobacter pelagius TaxID=379482 RepID=A0A366GMN3_9GAMM|nr:PAS domain S-box-containing protein/diguanylate cyclase (GGDEF)-like protein [Marinobacter pelagius]